MRRSILHITTWIFSATITIFLFFNSTNFDEGAAKILKNIEKIDGKLKNGILSEKAKDVLRGHKIYLINVLSKKIGLSDCEAIKKMVPRMKSGMYMAYHVPNAKAFDMIFCDVRKREQVLLDGQVSYEPAKPIEVVTYVPPQLFLQPPTPAVQPTPVAAVGNMVGTVKTQPIKAKCSSDEKATYRKNRDGSLTLYCSERNGGDNDR